MVGISTSTLCSSKFKRGRVDEIREFPRGCGRFPVVMDSRDGRHDIVDDGKPPQIPITQTAPRKYPPPRILKGCSVRRDFPCGFGRQDLHSASKGGLLSVSSTAKPTEKAAVETDPRICPPLRTLTDSSAKHVCPPPKQNLFSGSDHDISSNHCRKQSSFVSQENVSTNTCGNQNVGSVSKDIFPQNWKSIGDYPKPSNAARVANFRSPRFDDAIGNKKTSIHKESSANCDKVEEVLRLFHQILAKLMKENVAKLKMEKDFNVPRRVAMILKDKKKWINTSNRVGPVPGVNIGDKFRFQSELNVIGLHCHFYNGIHCMKKNGISLAISIVVSDRYVNTRESSDVLIYSGHGGNPVVQHGQPLKDQKLERGNLALKHSMDCKTPVRVIYKTKLKKSQVSTFGSHLNSSTILVYDGLYTVEEFWVERGEFGKLVFKYKLRRNLNQPKLPKGLTTNLRKISSFHRSGVVGNKIFKGKEKMPVRVVNMLDNETPPPSFDSTNMTHTNSW